MPPVNPLLSVSDARRHGSRSNPIALCAASRACHILEVTLSGRSGE